MSTLSLTETNTISIMEDELTCSICTLLLTNPMLHLSCGNLFCSSCVENVKSCPLCGNDNFKENSIQAPKCIQNILEKLSYRSCQKCKVAVDLTACQHCDCQLEACRQGSELKQRTESDVKKVLEGQTNDLLEELHNKEDQLLKLFEMKRREILNEFKEQETYLNTKIL